MLRSIKSGQRKMRIMMLDITVLEGNITVSGIDAKQVEVKAGKVTYKSAFGGDSTVQIFPQEGTKSTLIASEDKEGFVPSASCVLLIVGSDTSDRY